MNDQFLSSSSQLAVAPKLKGHRPPTLSDAERTKFQLISGHGRRYGDTQVNEFIYAGYRKQKIDKTKTDVARMRDHLKRVEQGQASRREEEKITHDDVGAMLQNLEAVKLNSRKFLTAQAAKSLRDEIAINHQRLAAKLFQAAAGGDLESCLEILRDEASAAERLAQLGGPDDVPYVQGQASVLANAVDADGRRPLHYAANRGDEVVVETLLLAGSDESAVDCNGYTALHYACRWSQARAVAQLVWAPQNDINATDTFGQTALHVAAASGGVQLVNVLIMRGCRASQKDHDGNSCLDIAKLHGDEDFATAVRLVHGLSFHHFYSRKLSFVSDAWPRISLFAYTHSVATEAGSAALAFGPGEFDIVSETSTMTDEREVTAAIITEVFKLGKASGDELDSGVLVMEGKGAHSLAEMLGGEVTARPLDTALGEQMEAEVLAWRRATKARPDYDALGSLIAAAEPGPGF